MLIYQLDEAIKPATDLACNYLCIQNSATVVVIVVIVAVVIVVIGFVVVAIGSVFRIISEA